MSQPGVHSQALSMNRRDRGPRDHELLLAVGTRLSDRERLAEAVLQHDAASSARDRNLSDLLRKELMELL